jgi:hypothetical protein
MSWGYRQNVKNTQKPIAAPMSSARRADPIADLPNVAAPLPLGAGDAVFGEPLVEDGFPEPDEPLAPEPPALLDVVVVFGAVNTRMLGISKYAFA